MLINIGQEHPEFIYFPHNCMYDDFLQIYLDKYQANVFWGKALNRQLNYVSHNCVPTNLSQPCDVTLFFASFCPSEKLHPNCNAIIYDFYALSPLLFSKNFFFNFVYITLSFTIVFLFLSFWTKPFYLHHTFHLPKYKITHWKNRRNKIDCLKYPTEIGWNNQ